ncbi:bacteriochlorophyll/chlorophyll a synthase [Rhizobium sp. Root274]|uniref:chlorophyll synthase ChlG n=1 Tax=unclassified Rhizobium TaxID=2613769 RepID=UPI00071637CC|nr:MULTISPECIES: chlorophyll synthase ChlG [unclassified Rhizobium]KQW29637.1 bacteriochlorophyll/chlorophyll a synthase [Rhizobium sp. Root1240]KRD29829.1 bacteriochlorophyll/chlorophyll a synthase [Rhizobium sp. Root274]
MAITPTHGPVATYPSAGAVLALLKPITWFPPMWAYTCGAIASGAPLSSRLVPLLIGILLAGPLLCGMSQAVNDWFDRHVDAINEPHRVIPSGRMPGRWGLYVALIMSVLSLCVAAMLGPLVLAAGTLGLVLAWGYSMPPLRFKQNGWIGNGVVGLSYETLPWITAAAAAFGATPSMPLLLVALLYGIGAHGILTLNDFKAIKGDREMDINTLPVLHGPRNSAVIACLIMGTAQAGVILLLLHLQLSMGALLVGVLLLAQMLCMPSFIRDPEGKAVWYSAVGVGLYVTGMMVTAIAFATAMPALPTTG